MLHRLLFIGLLTSLLGLLFLGSRLEQIDAPPAAVRVEFDSPDAPLLRPSHAISRAPASMDTRLEIEPISADENPSLNSGNLEEN